MHLVQSVLLCCAPLHSFCVVVFVCCRGARSRSGLVDGFWSGAAVVCLFPLVFRHGFNLMTLGVYRVSPSPPLAHMEHFRASCKVASRAGGAKCQLVLGNDHQCGNGGHQNVGICAHIGPPASTRSTAGHVHGRSAKRSKLMLPGEFAHEFLCDDNVDTMYPVHKRRTRCTSECTRAKW